LKNKKLKFTIFSLTTHIIIFVLLWAKSMVDATVLGVWLSSFNVTIGIYIGANVWQKGKISENYRSELEGK